MSNFNKASKSRQKTHRERGQLAARAHLGPLEKKKDYQQRAQDYHRKQNTIKGLKRKALDRNPDEFYFKMVRTKLEDGVHQSEDNTPVYTPDQLKLMQSQDIKYVNYKRNIESKKIDKMKGSLHMIGVDDAPKNKHIVFVDTKKEAKEFDAAKHLDTHPALLNRAYNRPRLDTLKKQTPQTNISTETLGELAAARDKQYKELGRRIEREKQLGVLSQKMETKKQLMDKKARRKKVADETLETAAVYKYVPQRKR